MRARPLEDVVALAILDGFKAAVESGMSSVETVSLEIRRTFPACPLSEPQLNGAVLLLAKYLKEPLTTDCLDEPPPGSAETHPNKVP